jgi:hypothetical protein
MKFLEKKTLLAPAALAAFILTAVGAQMAFVGEAEACHNPHGPCYLCCSGPICKLKDCNLSGREGCWYNEADCGYFGSFCGPTCI